MTLTETSTALIMSRSVQLISTSAAPEPPTPLMANDQGYVRVTTASQAIGCSITVELVACQTSSDDWPYRNNGRPAHTVSIGSDGQFHVVEGDLGALDGKIALSAKTYRAQGWIIVGDVDTVTFTNDQTGHGMRVSRQNVQPF